MSTDEHFDDDPEGADGPDGAVHGLLATAFDGDLPVLNLVPAAVAGYRRHRRRARVLGTAGAALALAGVVAAGTTLASGTGSASRTQTSADGSGDGAAAQGVAPTCNGIYHRFGVLPGSHLYSADSATLSRVCTRDVAALKAAIPGATIVAQRETYSEAVVQHDLAPGDRLPAGAGQKTELVQPGEYLVRISGYSTRLTLLFSDRLSWGFTGCEPSGCAPNTKLADGTPATESAAAADSGVSALSVQRDAQHWVMVMASTSDTRQEPLPFDFTKLVRSRPAAEMIAADVQDLDRLD